MDLKVRPNIKFYLLTAILLVFIVTLAYGIVFLNTNEILMDDGMPMADWLRITLTVGMSAVLLSWFVSFFVLIRQILIGQAFVMNDEGISTTLTASVVLAFIFVVPIETIPYSAIDHVFEENGILTVRLNKDQLGVSALKRFFIRSEYHFFYGLTKEKGYGLQKKIKAYLNEKNVDFL